MSTPAIRGIVRSSCQLLVSSCQLRPAALTSNQQLTTSNSQPCFCLCFTFVQITRTTPLRRTILQFSQIRRTLALTFMGTPSSSQKTLPERVESEIIVEKF